MGGAGIFEALGLIALAFMVGAGGYLFLTSIPRVTNAEARARLGLDAFANFDEAKSAALGNQPGGGSGPKRPSAAVTHTQIDVRTHRDGAVTR